MFLQAIICFILQYVVGLYIIINKRRSRSILHVKSQIHAIKIRNKFLTELAYLMRVHYQINQLSESAIAWHLCNIIIANNL